MKKHLSTLRKLAHNILTMSQRQRNTKYEFRSVLASLNFSVQSDSPDSTSGFWLATKNLACGCLREYLPWFAGFLAVDPPGTSRRKGVSLYSVAVIQAPGTSVQSYANISVRAVSTSFGDNRIYVFVGFPIIMNPPFLATWGQLGYSGAPIATYSTELIFWNLIDSPPTD